MSAGEALPAVTRKLWKDATGIEIIDGIGSTEMFHMFISCDEAHAKPGAIGDVVPGYRAAIMDAEGKPVPPGRPGGSRSRGRRGAATSPTSASATMSRMAGTTRATRILVDEDGFYVYQGRTDDMIITAGYNIGSPEVEGALLMHPAVADCGVIGAPDEERGQIVKAFVVLKPGFEPGPALASELQDFVKRDDRAVQVSARDRVHRRLPRTETGKVQRSRLRQQERERQEAAK